MFTGIIEEIGTVRSLLREGGRAKLTVEAEKPLEGTRQGDSIAIDGVCLTVADMGDRCFTVYTLAESLKKTTLGGLRPGSKVNLERALRPDSHMGGHFVQGHVVCTVPITNLASGDGNVYLSVELPDEQLRYCVSEGSIALDGMSLTIAKVRGSVVTINIIPATFEGTTLGSKKPGDRLNLETDIIGRYVERMLKLTPAGTGQLSAERLRELGY